MMKKYITLSLIFLTFTSLLNAAIEKQSFRISGSVLTQAGNKILEVADDKYPSQVFTNAIVLHSYGRIIFGVDQFSQTLTSNSADLFARIEITMKDGNGAFIYNQQIQILHIQFDYSLLTSVDLNIISHDNVHYIYAKLLNFQDEFGNIIPFSNAPSNLFLETEIETERYYALNTVIKPVSNLGITPILDANLNNAIIELDIHWDFIPGAEEYQLEWAYVDDYFVSSPIIRPLKNRENNLKSLNLKSDEKIKIYRNADCYHTQAV